MQIKNIDFPIEQYYAEEQIKKQIVLHHTVSDPTSQIGDLSSWLNDKTRIATYCIIGYDGTVNKCFKSTQWAHHLGVKSETLKAYKFPDYGTRNDTLNRHSIAIEIDAWGGLIKDAKGNYLNGYGKPISSKLEVVECDWRGYKHFQKYTEAQIQTLKELLPALMEANGIPSYGIKDGNFDVRMDALRGTPGIYSHSSFRKDKSDLFPDQDLIKMLNEI